jgi:hypothetical protein
VRCVCVCVCVVLVALSLSQSVHLFLCFVGLRDMKIEFIDNSAQQYDASAVEIKLPGNHGKGKLFLGDRWSASLLQLRARKCTRVVNCSQFLHKTAVEKSVKYLKIDPERDFNDENEPNPFTAAVKFISKALAKGETVLVHCETGKSKAAVVVIHFVMISCGLSLAASYKLVEKQSPEVRPRPSLVCLLIIEEKRERNDVSTVSLNGRKIDFDDKPEEMNWKLYMYGAAFALVAAVSIYSHASS